MKIAFLCSKGEEQFIPHIAKHVASTHEVRECYNNDEQDLRDSIQWADAVWIEWADAIAINLTNQHIALLEGKKVVVRLHSSEAVNTSAEKVNWKRVDAIVFVASHIQKIVEDKIKAAGILVPKMFLIPNGIDMNKWKITERPWSPDIAWVPTTIQWRKGPVLMLQALSTLVKYGSAWKLHVAGRWSDERDYLYARNMVQELEIENNILFYGFINNLADWYGNMTYVASFSQWEGNPVNIMEAMACGLRPVVHNFPGAFDQYKPEWVWNRISEFLGACCSDTCPEEYRQYVAERWDQEIEFRRVDEMLKEIL